jgi:hypothetical protein
LQSLTTTGVGSGTVLEFIQSHNSSDDGIEFFGGTHNFKRYVVTGADDDSLDLDTGYRGLIQYVISVQKTSGSASSTVELDSANTKENETPRTWFRIANFTFIHKNAATDNGAAMLLRGQSDVSMVNGVLVSPMPCLRLNGSNMLTTDAAIDKVGPPVFKSVVMQCGGTSPFVGSGGLTAAQVDAAFNVAGNNNSSAFTNSLTGGFINGANETGRTATDPKTINAGFDTTTYVGAVKDANDTWYAGWTCNSATASFGSTSKSCTSIP